MANHSLEMQDALRERCAYLIVIASIITAGKMVAKIIRRKSRSQILRDIKQEQNQIYKTGIHTSDIVNEAIDKIAEESAGSGTGLSPTSTVVPVLLKKRQELEKRGVDITSIASILNSLNIKKH